MVAGKIGEIILKYRTQLEKAGIMRRPEPKTFQPIPLVDKPVSVEQLMSSKGTISSFSVQLSPLTIFFDITIPRMQSLFEEIGESRAEYIIGRICEHSKKVKIQDGANEHLEKLFAALPGYEWKLRKDNGIAEIIAAYEKWDFEGRDEGYFRLKLEQKLDELNIDIDLFAIESAFARLPKDQTYQAKIDEKVKTAGSVKIKDRLIAQLYEHAKKMIAAYGIKRTTAHLKEMFADLSGYVEKIKDPKGLEEVLEAYRMLSLEGEGEKYLKLNLDDQIETIRTDEEGLIFLTMNELTRDADLRHLGKVKNLGRLSLRIADEVTDSGLAHISGSDSLRKLYLGLRHTDEGLRHISGLKNLRALNTERSQVDGSGFKYCAGLTSLAELYMLVHIKEETFKHLSSFPELQILALSWINVSDESAKHLLEVKKLVELRLFCGSISDHSAAELKQALPGMRIIVTK